MGSTKQLCFPFIPIEDRKKYYVYHDESGTDHKTPYELHGSLFVPQDKWHYSYCKLNENRNGFIKRIHYTELRDNSSSKLATVTKDWMNLYFSELADFCFYKCFVINTKSPSLRENMKQDSNKLYTFGH